MIAPGARTDQDVRGLALFLRNGMAAWMRGLSPTGMQHEQPEHASADHNDHGNQASGASRTSNRRAPGLDEMLVNILAAMTYANTMEVCP